MRIELTNEVVKAITMNCPIDPNASAEECFECCALAGACFEYWTGNNSMNKEESENV